MEQENLYDVVVIGAGPAGMMAATTAARRGRRVLLLEKNSVVGKKLAITGGGRCNVTNNRPQLRDLVSAYGATGKFLHSLFSRYGVRDTIEYFTYHDVALIEENEGRMFPATHKAETIVSVLKNDCDTTGVVTRCGVVVHGIQKTPVGFLVATSEGEYNAPACVVATGGTARPETGSTGEGFVWLEALGHRIVPDSKTLVPITVTDVWVPALAGVTVPEVKLVIRLDGKRVVQVAGKVLFTHVGLSGPSILNLSRQIGELLPMGTVTVGIRLFSELDEVSVRQKLQICLTEHSNQKIGNALGHLVTGALVGPLLQLSQINPDTPAHSVRSEERQRLSTLLFELPVTVRGLLGSDKAVASGGGVDLSEVDFRTMESKIVPGLFLVGDVLNINRPSGGYSLQLCWSTGAVAGMVV
jgi:predicted Rossmann fold flavoprotein